jgi:hypothetical protein
MRIFCIFLLFALFAACRDPDRSDGVYYKGDYLQLQTQNGVLEGELIKYDKESMTIKKDDGSKIILPHSWVYGARLKPE